MHAKDQGKGKKKGTAGIDGVSKMADALMADNADFSVKIEQITFKKSSKDIGRVLN